jgi:hypothetical protein
LRIIFHLRSYIIRRGAKPRRAATRRGRAGDALGSSLAVIIPHCECAISPLNGGEIGGDNHFIALTTPVNLNGAENRFLFLIAIVNLKGNYCKAIQLTQVNGDDNLVVQLFNFYMPNLPHVRLTSDLQMFGGFSQSAI